MLIGVQRSPKYFTMPLTEKILTHVHTNHTDISVWFKGTCVSSTQDTIFKTIDLAKPGENRIQRCLKIYRNQFRRFAESLLSLSVPSDTSCVVLPNILCLSCISTKWY